MMSRTFRFLPLRLNVSAIFKSNANKVTSSARKLSHHHWSAKDYAEKKSMQPTHQYLFVNLQRPFSIRTHVPDAAHVSGSDDGTAAFMALFPDIVRELTEEIKSLKADEAATWNEKALEYNGLGGKKNRAFLAISAYKNLVKPEELTPEKLLLIQYLAWYIEMLQCFFLIIDDIMDDSVTRRGQLCWHKMDNVGTVAINDALMIENGIYALLRKHFRHLDCYVDLLELFHQINFITTSGQSMDNIYSKKQVNEFNMNKYNVITATKTGYYSFYFPVAAALHLAGVKDKAVFEKSKAILLEMSQLYQVQDDFIDCFGDSDISGKIGTDIQDNKSSWLAVMCVEKCSLEQRAIMEECYGQKDPEKVARVKQLYKELDLINCYHVYEETKYNDIKLQIQQVSNDVPKDAFLTLLNKFYKRQT
ncbi:farnesyl pyrophosphate synthase-like [Zeugodacus cucurbitae]|uniref:farnesyl pyrophosphate synthase-like n=1 Tax=Zeugodacus cucurbitae TaxID=28588 RepID=UPI0023D956CF|nr:farnesyl pyrophosphate synthase-like [Zeugodacus cucurbitae]